MVGRPPAVTDTVVGAVSDAAVSDAAGRAVPAVAGQARESRGYADIEHVAPPVTMKVRGRFRVVWLALWLAAAAMYSAIAFTAEGQSGAWSDRLFRALFLVLAAVHMVGGVRGFGRSLDADGDGVVVRNRLVPGIGDSIPLQLRRAIPIPWRDLAAIEFEVAHEDVYRLVLLRRDRSRVAAQVPGGGIKPGQYLFELRERLLAIRDAALADPQAPTDRPTDATRTDQDAALPAAATRRRIVYWGTIAALVAGAALIGIITDTGDGDVTADPGQSPGSTPSRSPTKPGEKRVYWEDLKPGMCGHQDPDGQYFIVVACNAMHKEEVMSRGPLAGSGAWPGDTAVTDAAWAKCKPAFAAYVGLPFDDSQLDLYPLTPHQDTWKPGNATLTCLVFDPLNDHLVRSVRRAHY